MPTLSIRVEDRLYERIEDAAAGDDLSVSEWARQVFASDLGLDDRRGWSAPTSLTRPDRHQLSILHRLLAKATDDDEEIDHHQRMALVLQEGFSGEYDEVFVAVYEEMPIADCRLTWDLLNMFMLIDFSIDRIGIETVREIDEHAESFLSFRGLDGNDSRESKIGSYAAYLIGTGRWEPLAHHFPNGRFPNSHSPVLDSYVRMIEAYKSIMDEHTFGSQVGRSGLSQDELATIVKAVYHPSRRGDD